MTGIRDEDLLLRRLEAIEARQITMVEDMAEVKTRLKSINGSIADINAEVGGAPDWETRQGRPNLRDRVHILENDTSAAKAAHAALKSAENTRAQAWSNRQKYTLFVIALATFAMSAARFTGHGG